MFNIIGFTARPLYMDIKNIIPKFGIFYWSYNYYYLIFNIILE